MVHVSIWTTSSSSMLRTLSVYPFFNTPAACGKTRSFGTLWVTLRGSTQFWENYFGIGPKLRFELHTLGVIYEFPTCVVSLHCTKVLH